VEKEKVVNRASVYRSIAICFLIALLTSCMEQKELDYYPMSTGSEWEYVGKMTTGSGKIITVQSKGLIEGKERKYCPNNDFIDYKNPLPVALAITVRNKKFLLIKRGLAPDR